MARVNKSELLAVRVTPAFKELVQGLIDQGFYANQAEFFNIAIHNQLSCHVLPPETDLNACGVYNDSEKSETGQ